MLDFTKLVVSLVFGTIVEAGAIFKCTVGILEPLQGFNSGDNFLLESNGSCSFHKSRGVVKRFSLKGYYESPLERITMSCEGSNTVQVHAKYYNSIEIMARCTASFPLDVEMYPKIESGITFRKEVNGKDSIKHQVQVDVLGWDSGWDNATSIVFYSSDDPSFNITIQLTVLNFAADHMNVSSTNEQQENEGLSLYLSNGMAICEGKNLSSGELTLTNYIANNPVTTKMLIECVRKRFLCNFQRDDEVVTLCDHNFGKGGCIQQRIPSSGVICCGSQGKNTFLEYFTTPLGMAISNMSLALESKNVILLTDGFIGLGGSAGVDTSTNASKTYFETTIRTFFCNIESYILVLPIIWSVVFANGTETIIDNGIPGSSHKTLLIADIQMRLGMTAVKCLAGYWNSDAVASSFYYVHIKSLKESVLPLFSQNETTHIVPLGSSVVLNCTAEQADPSPLYEWQLLNNKLSVNDVTGRWKEKEATLVISKFTSFMAGDYICVATNIHGESKRLFKVRPPQVPGSKLWIYLSIAFGAIAILCGIIVSISYFYYLQRGRLSEMEIKLFHNGNDQGLSIPHEFAQHLPYNRDFEVDWDDFQLDDEKLGEGAFGIVFKGYLVNTNRTVAIKTVKAGAEKSVILALLAELKTLIYLGKHENIIEIIGACTEFLKDGQVYVMVEYCAGGSLELFLRENAETFQSHSNDGLKAEYDVGSVELYALPFDAKDLMNWSLQIANGMKYLENNKVIHGDLATRNILLSAKEQIKIIDFGLSRQLVKYDTYTKKSQVNCKLAWPWLALETLKSFEYTSKTDVWSYSVTLWEIFTLGQIPYAGMNWNEEFLEYLEDDLRLSPPKHASDQMYKLMMKCWNAEPVLRPNFQDIEDTLLQLE